MNIGGPPEKWIPFNMAGPTGYNPLLGVELELNHERGYDEAYLNHIRGQFTEKQLSFLGSAMFDASVAGVEFVSSPAQLKDHINMWPDILTKLRGFGYYVTTNSGGLHVHVSKKGLLPGQLNLLIALAFYGGQDWESFQTKVQGRTGSRWAPGTLITEACPGNITSSLSLAQDYIERLYDNREYSRRYARINLVPSETIEFRQGHATTSEERLLSRIEYADALMRFTRTACQTGTLRKVFPYGLPTVKVFMDWVRRYKRWPHLAAFEF